MIICVFTTGMGPWKVQIGFLSNVWKCYRIQTLALILDMELSKETFTGSHR